MKTRYKILIVIAITLFVYSGLFLTISSCSAVSECEILYNFYEYVGFSIISTMCGTVEGVYDLECDPENYEIRLNNEGYFLFFFVIIPMSVIVTIWYKDRK